jgi:hypothetical protein
MKTTLTLCSALLLVALTLPAQAAHRWDERNNDQQQLQSLVDELRTLTEQARSRRHADRDLINSLEDLIDRYDRPWRDVLLEEDFSDRDYTHNPTWQVRSGRFWVDRRSGLRSQVTPQPANQNGDSRQDLGSALLGTLLDQALGTDQSADTGGPATIELPLQIPERFALETVFSFRRNAGEDTEVSFSLYQDANRDDGYHVIVIGGTNPSLELVASRGRRNNTVIQRVNLTNFDPSQPHTLEWRRGGYGQIEILMDNTQLLRTRDRSYSGAFQRLAITNYGGDLAVQRVSLYSAQ